MHKVNIHINKLLCGVCMLQSRKATFNQYEIKTLCPLCQYEDENTLHFIITCKELRTVSILQGAADNFLLKVYPVFEYRCYIVRLSTQRNINRLEMVQRREARFVKGEYDRTSSVSSVLADLKWNTLQERRL